MNRYVSDSISLRTSLSIALPNLFQIRSIFLQEVGMQIRVGKTGSLGPWSRVIVYCRSVKMLPVIILGIRRYWPQRSCFANPRVNMPI